MLDQIMKFLELLTKVSKKRFIALVIVAFLSLFIMKIDYIVGLVKEMRSSKNSGEVQRLYSVLDNLEIKTEDQKIIEDYTRKYFMNTPPTVFMMGIYKFLPTGDENYYQGRSLVIWTTKNSDPKSTSIREINNSQIPIWSGHKTVERLLERKITISVIDPTGFSVYIMEGNSRIVDNVSQLNLQVIYDQGVRKIIRVPIVKGNRTIGYIAWGIGDIKDDELQQLILKSWSLGAYIVNYMVN